MPAVEPHVLPMGSSPQFVVILVVGFGSPSPVIVLPIIGGASGVALSGSSAQALKKREPQAIRAKVGILGKDMAVSLLCSLVRKMGFHINAAGVGRRA
jgi:hypothetical protein